MYVTFLACFYQAIIVTFHTVTRPVTVTVTLLEAQRIVTLTATQLRLIGKRRIKSGGKSPPPPAEGRISPRQSSGRPLRHWVVRLADPSHAPRNAVSAHLTLLPSNMIGYTCSSRNSEEGRIADVLGNVLVSPTRRP